MQYASSVVQIRHDCLTRYGKVTFYKCYIPVRDFASLSIRRFIDERTIILALSSNKRFDSACFPDLNINSYNGYVLIEVKGERECKLQILANLTR